MGGRDSFRGMMKMNMRRDERHRTMFRSKILDALTKEPIGNQLDISDTGLCIYSKQPQEIGDSLLLELMLPWKYEDLDSITFEALVRWCVQEEESGEYIVGLEITDPDQTQLAVFNFIQEKHCLPV